MVLIMGLKSVRFKPKISKILGHFIRMDVSFSNIHFFFDFEKWSQDLKNTVDFLTYFTTAISLHKHKILSKFCSSKVGPNMVCSRSKIELKPK